MTEFDFYFCDSDTKMKLSYKNARKNTYKSAQCIGAQVSRSVNSEKNPQHFDRCDSCELPYITVYMSLWSFDTGGSVSLLQRGNAMVV